MSTKMEALRQMIDEAENIVFFGGAGVSTASGIPDFRGTYGLFKKENNIAYEEMLSHEHFTQKPEDFYEFYTHKMLYPWAVPNGAHRAVAELERQRKLTCVVTQNIDGLHTKAGNTNVVELHGSALRNTCLECGHQYDINRILESDGSVPYCICGGIIKPDVVLYGEALDEKSIEKAVRYISGCDLLMIAGTSLMVYPAAGFIRYAKGKIVLLNRDGTAYDSCADLVIQDDLAQVLEEAVFN